MSQVQFRVCKAGDYDTVSELLRTAFEGEDEVTLVDALRRESAFTLEAVAIAADAVAGYVGFASVKLMSDGVAHPALQLLPLAVCPTSQGRGIGAALTRAALAKLKGPPGRVTFVLGHPDYYPRFGFSAELAARYHAPWGGPAFMALADAWDQAPPTGELVVPQCMLGD